MIHKSVKSINRCKSLPCRQAGAIQMSYDIIIKGHGGSLELNTKGGMGAEFIIQLLL